MTSRLLKLYHRLPPRMRSAAATLRGWYLNRWRYGSDSGALMEEALERDHWTAAQWEAVGWTMQGLNRQQAARKLKIRHQNVSKRLGAAGWPAVALALKYIGHGLSHPKKGAIENAP